MIVVVFSGETFSELDGEENVRSVREAGYVDPARYGGVGVSFYKDSIFENYVAVLIDVHIKGEI